jgi:hypothetical protein
MIALRNKKYNYSIIYSPKVASTMISYGYVHIHEKEFPSGYIKRKRPRFVGHDPEIYHGLKNTKDLLKGPSFCVVRDPFSRFVSSFNTLILNVFEKGPIVKMAKRVGIKCAKSYDKITFIDIVDYVLSVPNSSDMDVHFLPQTGNVSDDLIASLDIVSIDFLSDKLLAFYEKVFKDHPDMFSTAKLWCKDKVNTIDYGKSDKDLSKVSIADLHKEGLYGKVDNFLRDPSTKIKIYQKYVRDFSACYLAR